MFSQSRSRIVLLALVVLALFGSATEGKKTGKVLTTNEKQAASLQAAAVFLKPGNYKLTNVQTGQTLYYVPKGNHVYPQKGKYTKASIARHSNKKIPWHRLQLGTKNKCLSSAWGSSGNNAGVMYVCASGANAQKTTLEKTKQWWLFVPVHAPTAKASSNSYANSVLLAAQADSIATREKKIAAQKAAFGRRSLSSSSSSVEEHGRMMRTVRRRALEKRANKTASSGTYYIIAIDHLLDRAAALTGKQIVTRGIKNTVISNWKNGNKAQQWKVQRV